MILQHFKPYHHFIEYLMEHLKETSEISADDEEGLECLKQDLEACLGKEAVCKCLNKKTKSVKSNISSLMSDEGGNSTR